MDRRTFLRNTALVAGVPTIGGCTQLATSVDRSRGVVSVAVSWGDIELAAFRDVLDELDRTERLGYAVELIPMGDDIEKALDAKAVGRPDIVMLPRAGQVLERREDLEPLPRFDDVEWLFGGKRFAKARKSWQPILHGDGDGCRPYGLPFRLVFKSLVWYDKDKINESDVPDSWSDWLELKRKEASLLSLPAADGWMLTDLFENILLGLMSSPYDQNNPYESIARDRSWHGAKYQLQSGLTMLGQLLAGENTIAGGVDRAKVLQFPDSLHEVFREGKAAMVIAPDFADAFVRQLLPDNQDRRHRVGVFRFPRMGPGRQKPALVGGDVAVLTAPASEEAKDLVRRLARPNVARPWSAQTGSFISAYPASTARMSRYLEAERISEIANGPFAFDLSDRIGPLGGRDGLWKVLQIFLAKVGNQTDDTIVDDAVKEAMTDLTRTEKVMDSALTNEHGSDGCE